MAQNTAMQELIERLQVAFERGDKKYKPAFEYWLNEAKNLLPKDRQDISDNVCSFLDWIHSEGWMVFRSTPEIIWFKEGAYAMKTNEQLYYYFTYTQNK